MGREWGELVGNDLLARRASTNSSNICSRQPALRLTAALDQGPQLRGGAWAAGTAGSSELGEALGGHVPNREWDPRLLL